jgi:hypothetical protein
MVLIQNENKYIFYWTNHGLDGLQKNNINGSKSSNIGQNIDQQIPSGCIINRSSIANSNSEK